MIDGGHVIATNAIVGLLSAYGALHYGRWAWRERSRADVALRCLPLAVAAILTGLTIEASYYSLARMLLDEQLANLWKAWPAVLTIRGSMAVAAMIAILVYWHGSGMPGPMVRRRAAVWGGGCVAVWAWLAWVL